MSTRAVVDRLEGDQAVLEVDGEERVVSRASLPDGVREGDVIDLSSLQVDERATRDAADKVARARARAQKKKFTGGSL